MLATSQVVPLKEKHMETFRMNSERTGSPEIGLPPAGSSLEGGRNLLVFTFQLVILVTPLSSPGMLPRQETSAIKTRKLVAENIS